LSTMFADLPTVKRSKAKDNVTEWLNGSRVSETWAASFDKFADFIESVLEGYLPWLLDACANLSSARPSLAGRFPWAEYIAIVKETTEKRHTRLENSDH
jgi:hypothetical protein